MKPILIFLLLVVLSPSLRAELKLDHVRLTYGQLGPARPEAKVLPGDELTLAFTISGLTKDEEGQISIALGGELVDDEGKPVIKAPTKALKNPLVFGGTDIPGRLTFILPDTIPAGKYVVRGVLKDVLAGTEARTERAVEVLPLRLGIVRMQLTSDEEGRSPTGGNLTVGETLNVPGRVVGFARQGKRINLAGNMQILDAAGKSTSPKPLSFLLDQEVPEDVAQATFKFLASASRPGRFTVRIEVHDKVAGKTAIQELPIVIHAPPGETAEKNSAPKTGGRKKETRE
jgi:hypothetical protein